MRAFCELSEDGKLIEVFFSYSPDAVAAIRAVPGRKFRDNERGKYWTIPADLTSAQRLREEFGAGLELGNAVKVWGREEASKQRNLGTLVTADDAELDNVRPDRAAWLRPYQRADVKMMALTNVLNANQPGVGKTVEVIYAVEEAKLPGPHLVIAPITLHRDPWLNELMEHGQEGIEVVYGDTPAERRDAISYVAEKVAGGTAENIWLILNPDAVRTKKYTPDDRLPDGLPVLSRDHKGNAYCARDEYANQLFKIEWGSVTLDEFHKHGLGEDRNTLYARAVDALGKNAARRYALSGTPMGGKPIRLWGCLYFIEPTSYGSKWRWAEQWLDIDDDGFGKSIGDIVKGREAAFYESHAKHMVRRTRKEALPGLPDKVVINVPVKMTHAQRKAYDDFATAAEVLLEGGRVSANGVLAEFARLKQFSNAKCEVRDGEVFPTRDSGKLPVLLERLDEFGCRKDNPEPNARAIVASESKRMVQLVAEVLRGEGLSVKELTGEVKGKDRDATINWYKEETSDARVLVMTTQTGGVGLNLGMTGSIHILDETWNPDDQEQLEDRGMRNRTTPLMVLYYRTEDSIQEYISEIGFGKKKNNKEVLDTIRSVVASRRAREGAAPTPVGSGR